jgi:hypothetical protein
MPISGFGIELEESKIRGGDHGRVDTSHPTSREAGSVAAGHHRMATAVDRETRGPKGEPLIHGGERERTAVTA